MKKSAITEFVNYVDDEILPATDELKKLGDKNRKHLQKLVYTNLVNRFDSMIDHAIIDNYDSEELLNRGLQTLNTNVTEADMLRLLLKGKSIANEIRTRIEAALSATILRERHCKKLSTLFQSITSEKAAWNHPRVNVSTGSILTKRTIDNKQIPHSICGYADWLYSRRNALVHGAGNLIFLDNDKEQIKKLFGVTVGNQIVIRLGSITTAANYYKNVCKIFTTLPS